MFFFVQFFFMAMDTVCPLAEYYCVLNLQPEAENEAECQRQRQSSVKWDMEFFLLV